MAERIRATCVSWLGGHGFVEADDGRNYFVASHDVPPNEGGLKRLYRDEEIEFTPCPTPGKKPCAKGIEFITRVPWFPHVQIEGTVREWNGRYGFLAANIEGSMDTFFFRPSGYGASWKNFMDLPEPFAGQRVVFDTHINDLKKTEAINIRFLD